jgi:hypothetical protein
VAAQPQHTFSTGLVPPGYDALMHDRADAALRRALRRLPAGAAARRPTRRSGSSKLSSPRRADFRITPIRKLTEGIDSRWVRA